MSQDCISYFKKKEKEWEGLCSRCGGCCGAYDDPCKHLEKSKDDKFCCIIYDRRFGSHSTIKGEEFDCVKVKEILNTYWKKDYLCIYKKLLRQGWLA